VEAGVKNGEEDFVESLRRRVEKVCLDMGVAPQIAASIAAEVDIRTRREDGTCEVYIPKNGPVREEKKRAALDEVSKTGNVAAAADRYGISRMTVYRLLKK
jgi:transcriptional regulator of acetoin/glycerol metabolism